MEERYNRVRFCIEFTSDPKQGKQSNLTPGLSNDKIFVVRENTYCDIVHMEGKWMDGLNNDT